LHPEEERHHFPAEASVAWDPIRRDQKENEDWYRDLVEHSQDLLCVHDLEGRFLSMNPVPARLLGYSVSELLEIPMRDLIDPRFRTQFEDYLREIEQTGESHGVLAVMTRTGERRFWEYHNTLRTQGVEKALVRGIAHDVTDRVRAEKSLHKMNDDLARKAHELEESEERFRAVYERSPVGICRIETSTGRFLQANPKYCELTGRTERDLLSRDFYSITHPDDLPANKVKAVRLAKGEIPSYEIEKRYVRPDGAIRWVNVAAVSLPGGGPSEPWSIGIAQDITERRQAEESLRKSEERLRLAQEAAHIGMFERNLLTGESRWTPQMESMYGLAPGDFPKTIEKFVELVHPDDRQEMAGLLARSVETGEAKGEWRVIWPDGTVHWISGRWRVFKDGSGKPARAIGMDFDITERKQAEEALRISEERFRVALKHSLITVFNQDRDLRYTWVYNPQLSQPVSELLGKTPEEFEVADAQCIMEGRRRVLETGQGTHQEVEITDGGRRHYMDTTIEPVLDSNGAVIGITGASMDVTELRETAEALREAQNRLTEEKLYLEREIDTELGFGEIIGRSEALQAVMQDVGKVAACNATVLLLGETGTGKELVARAIHRLSGRSNNSFIKLNCAAIPSGLLESELFGHERGAFTGAVSRKIGRLELADKGTLFLDEIGEISIALQPKLLRVLQDQEFERLGGTQTLKVDFRLIAATNRDLLESVRENEFRSDLYYRLNVFPVRVPPLRERREDIQLLVEHFAEKFARRMNKSITSIPKKTMDALREWEWPGNVRELENFVERSVILTHGSVLVVPLSELRVIAPGQAVMDETLEAAEREHILRALQESHGRISGTRGAAARLGLKRTTLQSKLKHLGISPRSGQWEH